jgi:hypothetical protein
MRVRRAGALHRFPARPQRQARCREDGIESNAAQPLYLNRPVTGCDVKAHLRALGSCDLRLGKRPQRNRFGRTGEFMPTSIHARRDESTPCERVPA